MHSTTHSSEQCSHTFRMMEFVGEEVKARWKWSVKYEREIEFWKESIGYLQRTICRTCIRLQNTTSVCVFGRYVFHSGITGVYSSIVCARHIDSDGDGLFHACEFLVIASGSNRLSHFSVKIRAWISFPFFLRGFARKERDAGGEA